ncbi:hypothetical protein O1611_g3719 [Lasiodiplodia mahajangana]|uniref:Uncharacterized protein n=1 Tax=Lasiodiplodia mahajangana TaxID=1108764 RepID=A0ACC2JRC3_9PEZI|nr:hypothetical protein O1611_g3719 [Lasiodiplodia mahajangana]
MIISILVQAIYGTHTDAIDPVFNILQNLLLIRGGWSSESSISIFEAVWPLLFKQDGVTIVLHDFDECDRYSRMAFMSYFSALANRVEIPIKLVVTSRKPNALSTELGKWPTLNVDAHTIDTALETGRFADDLVQCCPNELKRQEIQGCLEKLAGMEQETLRTVLRMLLDHTGWPNDPSPHSLSLFVHLLSLVSPSDTPEKVLDKIIRSDPHTGRLGCVVGWLLCSYRPLSLNELATIVEYYDRPNTPRREPLELRTLTPKELKARVRLFAEFRDNRAVIRPHIRRLLENQGDDSYVWNQIVKETYQTSAEYFCRTILTSDKGLELLKDTVSSFESALREQQKRMKVATLVLPCDENILLYAVQAWPYHLSKCISGHHTSVLRTFLDKDVSTLWAKAYWAMSNPFSRTPTIPDSALPLCASLGLVGRDDVNLEGESSKMQPAVATIMENLLSAIQADDENTALAHAKLVVSHPQWDARERNWPHSAIWAAVWLNMVNLTTFLLDNGVVVEIDSDVEPIDDYWRSVLHLASVLNRPAIIDILLLRSASSKALSLPTCCFQDAAWRGHFEAMQSYLNYYGTYVNDRQLSLALIDASEWGAWKCVNTLTHMRADVNFSKDKSEPWTPLAIACSRGHQKTVEALLEGNADVNAVGPYGVETALWFTTCHLPNVDCTRAMLKHKADPNHRLFDPPLLTEMVSSKHDAARILAVCDALLDTIQPIDLNAPQRDGKTPLMIASRDGKLDWVKWLITNGASIGAVNMFDRSALFYGVERGHADVVAVLLEKGALRETRRISSKRDLLLDSVSKVGVIRQLLSYGVDTTLTNADGDTAINIALESGAIDVVELLIKSGADIDHRDRSGQSPIFYAVGHSLDHAVVRLLAENGAKMDNIVNNKTLLHLALDGDPEVLSTLLEFRNSIDVDILDGDGFTALHRAISNGDIRYVQILIRAGADLTKLAPNGDTALHIAARDVKTIDHLKLLLDQSGVDINRISLGSGTPLCVAARYLNLEGIDMLLDRGADVDISLPNSLHSTSLTSVLTTFRRTMREDDILIIDKITRMFVRNSTEKADVKQTIPGNGFYTALAAACFYAGPMTLKFLIEQGADAYLAHELTGRLPHHFAAANGIENFGVIMSFYHGDMMTPDNAQKNCLHWAAQFGNFEVVKFILSRLHEEGRLVDYINEPDSDGWTPLCWAARPFNGGVGKEIRSEKPNFAGVVKLLLQNGAKRDVKCAWRHGWVCAELTLTPLDLARRCNPDQGIMTILQGGRDDRAGLPGQVDASSLEPDRVYAYHETITCVHCLNPIGLREYQEDLTNEEQADSSRMQGKQLAIVGARYKYGEDLSDVEEELPDSEDSQVQPMPEAPFR